MSVAEAGAVGPPDQGDRSDAAVLRRGLAAFAELGYAHTTVRELARRIGVNHNFVGDRFGSKLDFWFAVVDFAVAEAELSSFGGDGTLPDEELLREVVRHFYRTAAHHPHLHRLFAEESAHESERMTYLFDKYIEPCLRQLRPVLVRLAQAGRLPRAPQHVLFFAVIGPTLGMTHAPLARRLGRPDDPAITDLEGYADQFADMVIAGLLLPPA
ncbi:TetR/AcrR family transcriptional regulator [Actinocorallia sp. A-T 12471]|uniref:TetR/AcrR family transcriptional regulator n=1 Tax=Actinocorallia sp. A-T 12471 TaxID=3089813 RepID=UPI0029CCDBE0|nr:TetR/AcrR family transcriptional regulator [Actinocorallia sp. A-T 12471]MDX6740100.1 TetR/AcrR family transcriptional regulator [Actinocorallia sp. A-T 12471]